MLMANQFVEAVLEVEGQLIGLADKVRKKRKLDVGWLSQCQNRSL